MFGSMVSTYRVNEHYVYNPIQEIGVFGKIAELVGNPSTITYDAKAMKNDQVISKGVLEVTFLNKLRRK